ncbi:MAG: hypothetical protein ACWGQW_11935 [bacterium]
MTEKDYEDLWQRASVGCLTTKEQVLLVDTLKRAQIDNDALCNMVREVRDVARKWVLPQTDYTW